MRWGFCSGRRYFKPGPCRGQATIKKGLRALFLCGGVGKGREQETKTGREQMRGTVLIQATEHRGTFLLPFFAKRERAGERLQAVPAREKIKGRGSAPGHGRMSITERLAGQGSGHCPKPRAAVAYGPSPGYCPQQCRAYRPDKAAGTARPGLLRGGKGFTFLATYFAWPARPYTAPGFL